MMGFPSMLHICLWSSDIHWEASFPPVWHLPSIVCIREELDDPSVLGTR